MNPLTNVQNLERINKTELDMGVVGGMKTSWHNKYKDSAWIFVGGLPYDLTEGDIICVFSQYGEIVNINLVRDQKTGKSKGFCFICFEDQLTTILSVDNLNGIKILSRTIRVDHVEEYRVPKQHDDEDELTKKLRDEGCAPKIQDVESESEEEEEEFPFLGDPGSSKATKKKKKKDKKEKKNKKKKKKKKYSDSDSESASNNSSGQRSNIKTEPGYVQNARVRNLKREKVDPAYNKYADEGPSNSEQRDRNSDRERGDSRNRYDESRSRERTADRGNRDYDDSRSRGGNSFRGRGGSRDYRDDSRNRNERYDDRRNDDRSYSRDVKYERSRSRSRERYGRDNRR